MRILSLKPGHDGSIAFIDDGHLVMSLEAEKGSFPRYSAVTAQLVLEALQLAPAMPDILAIGGWHKYIPNLYSNLAAGYAGIHAGRAVAGALCGAPVTLFSSTHERSHIFMAAGMHPAAPLERCTVLVWEGTFGAFYEWREGGQALIRHHVMSDPGAKYSALFALADPAFAPYLKYPRLGDAGKLMALAAYGTSGQTNAPVRATVDHLIALPHIYPFNKADFEDSPLYDCGLDDPQLWNAAAYITDRIYKAFYAVARQVAERGSPLVISGGCGLNCDWNERWRRSGLFSDVFVPPCANDSGSAIGTAIDAQVHVGGKPQLTWSVYSGNSFVVDAMPDTGQWIREPLNMDELAGWLCAGEIVAWVQGRYEIGPRALGNRSLLASPLAGHMRDRLNELKGREWYRPIAPCCRIEEVDRWFASSAPDPYMLFFSSVRNDVLPAVTHVDGSARVQAVSSTGNARLHDLLTAFGTRTGYGVLCNTSLNFSGVGFINCMTELETYCRSRGIRAFVVNDDLYRRRWV